jgi:hypothetical protein
MKLEKIRGGKQVIGKQQYIFRLLKDGQFQCRASALVSGQYALEFRAKPEVWV